MSSVSLGVGRQSSLVGVCNVKFGNPLASGGQSSPKLTPTLFASSHMLEKGISNRTYFARGQVPDRPDVRRAKNKLPSWDKYLCTITIYIYIILYYIYDMYNIYTYIYI